MEIARVLVPAKNPGQGVACMPIPEVDKSFVPVFLDSGIVLGGQGVTAKFRRDLHRKLAKGGAAVDSKLCDVDKALVFALDNLWVFADSMSAVRERAALRTLQRCLKQGYLKRFQQLQEDAPPGLATGDATAPEPSVVAQRLTAAKSLDAQMNQGGQVQETGAENIL
mmetsp:Transcript_28818/g.64432  ORF Transcript_28818/g.64432 Transcript_28818/m.64432 type:complete len:167 (-) Transcript_28818:394-894(-)